MTAGGVALRRVVTVLVSGMIAATMAPVAQAGAQAPGPRAAVGKPIAQTARYIVVQRSRVRLDIGRSAGIRRVRAVSALPRHMTLRDRVLRGWAPKGRTVVRLKGISTLRGQRGKRVRLKVVVVGRPQVARRGTGLVTRAPGGQPGNGFSYGTTISTDGSTVAFISEATNLLSSRLPRTTPAVSRAFAWDRRSGRTELLSVAPDGSPMTSYSQPQLSASGSRALFQSSDEATYGLYLRDRDAATTRLLATGVRTSAISADGNLVTYVLDGRSLRLDLRTGSTTDLGVASFMAVSPNARYLAVRDEGRFLIWDATARAVVRERPLVVQDYCGWTMFELTDDAARGVVSAGCDHTYSRSLEDTATATTLARSAVLDANPSASWVLMANGRAHVEMGPVGGRSSVLSKQPAPVFVSPSVLRWATPSVAIAGDGDVAVWSTGGGNVVRNAYTPHSQVYIWTSGR